MCQIISSLGRFTETFRQSQASCPLLLLVFGLSNIPWFQPTNKHKLQQYQSFLTLSNRVLKCNSQNVNLLQVANVPIFTLQ